MGEIADRYRRVAGQFRERVEAVPDGAWDNPAPCEGWVARDVVAHLAEWLPGYFFPAWGIEAAPGPPVADDPAGAWAVVDTAIQSALDDPDIATSERDVRTGRASFEQTVDMICTTDVLVHTWDLARATGLDEALDPIEVKRMLDGIEPHDAALRESGHYGPRVAVAADADDQTRLLAFLGRRP